MIQMKRNRRNNSKEKSKIKIYEKIKENMAAMGFTPNQQTQNSDWKLSRFQIIVITILSIDVGTLCVFLFYEASGIEEYMDAIFELTTEVGMFSSFISLIFKNDDIFVILETTTNELTESE